MTRCLCKAGRFSYGENSTDVTETLGDLQPVPPTVYDLFTVTSEFTLPEAVTQMTRCLCKAGRFSYGESPRTPPLEGTSLHRRNNSVERPWGSLFTTCLQLQVNSPCQRLTQMTRCLCKAGRFSYGESPRTPPLEGTSLHR